MPRKPREHIPHAFYHVILRGNNGQNIFFCDEDKHYFCDLIQKGIAHFGNRIHAFCLMSNHVHVLIQPQEISLSTSMQNLSFCYTQYINEKEKRFGHLFHGRFTAIRIKSEVYLIRLLRYIHLNPVRAALVKQPEDYFWSSHKTYLGENVFPWVLQKLFIDHFGSGYIAMQRYRHFIDSSINIEETDDFLEAIRNGELSSYDEFNQVLIEEPINSSIDKIDFASLEELVTIAAEVLNLSVNSMLSQGKDRKNTRGRAICAYLVKRCDRFSLKDLADIFKRDYSSLTRQAKDIEENLKTDSDLQNIIDTILKRARGLDCALRFGTAMDSLTTSAPNCKMQA